MPSNSSASLGDWTMVQFSKDDAVIDAIGKKPALLDLQPFPEELGKSEDDKARWQNLQAEIALPLLSKGQLVGVLVLGPKANGEAYYKEDIELLETLGDQINIALENALLTEELREQERLKKELEVARRIQLSSLPQRDPDVAGLEVTGVSIPALEVGGDYYDYLNFADGRFGVVVGDVSGKGTSAALYMSQLKGILKTAVKFHRSLKELITEVNALTFGSIEESSFITLTCGVFDLKNRKMHLVRAGHLPLIHYSAKKKLSARISPKGIGIGLENGEIFRRELQEQIVSFQSGDVFLFYTDGIVEACGESDDEIEGQKLLEMLHANGALSAKDLREKILSELQTDTALAQKDDMTLVVVRVL
jgi:serine phosphatase RsbU (regulator of sigma subunit)